VRRRKVVGGNTGKGRGKTISFILTNIKRPPNKTLDEGPQFFDII